MVAIITDMVDKSGQGLVLRPNEEILLFNEDTEKSVCLKQYVTDGIISILDMNLEPDTGEGGGDEEAVAALEARVDALEVIANNHEMRIRALEALT